MNERSSKRRNDLLRLLAIAAFFAALMVLLGHPGFREKVFDIERVRGGVQSGGWRAHTAFLATAAVGVAVGVPRLWICAVAGSLYGALLGTAFAQAASLIGAAIGFGAGRWLLQGPASRLLPARLVKWRDRFQANAFYWVLCLRLIPISNAGATNIFCGAMRVPFSPYLAATFLGQMPYAIGFALMGSSAAKENSVQFLAGLAVLALIFGAGKILAQLRGGEVKPPQP